MRNYLKRIKENSKVWEICYWWIFRGLMIYALIVGLIGFFKGENDFSDPLQVMANLAAMFAWEIFMMFPKKSILRQMPSFLQDVSVVVLFAASFCGKFLNFYYEVRLWDSVMHLVGGGLCVLLGYQIVVAMQMRDKKICSVPIALFCAFCFSFFASTLWELFEFAMDQVMCMGGSIGDAQHWSFTLAQGTPKEATLFDPVYADRWPIMDTMADIVLNTVGAVIVWIVLKFVPFYHNKGKNDVNKKIENMLEFQDENAAL